MVGGLWYELRRRDDDEITASLAPLDRHTYRAEDLGHDRDVGYVGNVRKDVAAFAEKACGHELQHRVLRATRADGAVQRAARLHDEAVGSAIHCAIHCPIHWGKYDPPRHMPSGAELSRAVQSGAGGSDKAGRGRALKLLDRRLLERRLLGEAAENSCQTIDDLTNCCICFDGTENRGHQVLVS